ncbi:hypothetical protein SDC9_76029 [bioreactor metagenome]|uniref:Uncharacterized protein n=1 Tax=bioreactor metagenome TaxID=1076179 RepID=A0A644YME7_9ZZZZ
MRSHRRTQASQSHLRQREASAASSSAVYSSPKGVTGSAGLRPFVSTYSFVGVRGVMGSNLPVRSRLSMAAAALMPWAMASVTPCPRRPPPSTARWGSSVRMSSLPVASRPKSVPLRPVAIYQASAGMSERLLISRFNSKVQSSL